MHRKSVVTLCPVISPSFAFCLNLLTTCFSSLQIFAFCKGRKEPKIESKGWVYSLVNTHASKLLEIYSLFWIFTAPQIHRHTSFEVIYIIITPALFTSMIPFVLANLLLSCYDLCEAEEHFMVVSTFLGLTKYSSHVMWLHFTSYMSVYMNNIMLEILCQGRSQTQSSVWPATYWTVAWTYILCWCVDRYPHQ